MRKVDTGSVMDHITLKETIRYEKEKTLGDLRFRHLAKISLTRQSAWLRYRFVKYMRLANYYGNSPLGLFFAFKRNKYATKLNFEITGINIGKGLTILHNGPIVIHGGATLGENIVLHGNNCIGNNGITDECPHIGNNVDIGFGAIIIGNVYIADNVRIGAGAVVVRDVLESGATVVGVPAHKV